MHNTCGMIYRVFAVGGIMLIIGIILLAKSKFWIRDVRKICSSFIAFMIIMFALIYIFFFTYKAINPSIEFYTGFFVGENRIYRVAPPLPFTFGYTFYSESNAQSTFYLDTFSRKAIFPDEFSENMMYRIAYDKHTHIIIDVNVVLP